MNMKQSEPSSTTMRIEIDDKNHLLVRGYRLHHGRCALSMLGIVATLGFLLIPILARKDFKMFLFYQLCSLQQATKVLVTDSFGQLFEEIVQEEKSGSLTRLTRRSFTNKQIKFVWNNNALQFERLRTFDSDLTCDEFFKNSGGLNLEEIEERKWNYGSNLIEITVSPIHQLIFTELSNPFYLFQLYTVIVWMAERYYDYSALVLVTTVLAVGASVYETRKQKVALKKRAEMIGSNKVVRNGVEITVMTLDLVPGDVIYIDPKEPQVMHCDAVLIEGTCYMDESMLTGESKPITKLPVTEEDTTFNYETHSRHILFCGTQLMQGRSNHSHLKAVVIRTGFTTSKGELIRAMLFPKPIDLRFYSDIIKVSTMFFIIAIGGMIYTMIVWIKRGATALEVFLDAFDIMTFAVPPSLPAALTATTALAQRRLKAKQIFCLSAKHISLCGGVDVICFDKTGTLTETDIELCSSREIVNGEFKQNQTIKDSENGQMLMAMASCHSVIRVNNQLSGSSVDVKMFEATGWSFKDGPTGTNFDYGIETPYLVSPPSLDDNKFEGAFSSCSTELAILKRFPFNSLVKRMAVITRRKGREDYTVYLKGAPEVIAALCDPDSVPSDYDLVLKHYTLQGYRVLALAAKTLSPDLTWADVQRMPRKEVEMNPELVGLLIFQNGLKKETIASIKELEDANLYTMMVTGDNLQTAITVAKDCTMIHSTQKMIQVKAAILPSSPQGDAKDVIQVNFIDPLSIQESTIEREMRMQDAQQNGNYCFVLDGPSFELLRIHNPALLDRCIHRAKVFARMSPEHKQHLIECLQKLGRQVAMVGDGCNDCGALRTADAGISLSMADASVAAPFTSQQMNISCVAPLIREGRTTLDAAFSTFQFSVGLYFSLFIGMLIMYSIGCWPSDFQFLIWTLIITAPFYLLGNGSPPDNLHPRRPLRHLWGFLPLFSFFSFILWQTAVFIVGWFYCYAQPWFEPFVYDPDNWTPNASYEETTMFFLINIGSVAAAFVFAPCPPYSRNILSNPLLTIWSILAAVVVLCFIFITDDGFVAWMNFKSPPDVVYKVFILTIGVIGGLVCFLWEKYFIRVILYQRIWPVLHHIRRPRHQYQRIEKEELGIYRSPQSEEFESYEIV